MRVYFIISLLIWNSTSYSQVSNTLMLASHLNEATHFDLKKNTNESNYTFPKNIVENCMEVKPPKLCYTFSEENPPLDSLNSPIKYRWRMGNGYVSWGKKIHYCYLTVGSYDVHLDYVDTLTGIEYNDVGTYHLEIKPNNTLSIVFPDSITQGETITIKYKNFLNTTKIETPIWSINDSKIGEGKTIEYQFQEVGKHHIILKGIPNYTQTDSSNCTYKNINVFPNKNTIKNKNQVELIFEENEYNLSPSQIDALTFFIKNTPIESNEIYLKKTEYASNRDEKKIEQKLEDFFVNNGISKSKLHFVHNLKISSSPTKYNPKRVTISLKNH